MATGDKIYFQQELYEGNVTEVNKTTPFKPQIDVAVDGTTITVNSEGKLSGSGQVDIDNESIIKNSDDKLAVNYIFKDDGVAHHLSEFLSWVPNTKGVYQGEVYLYTEDTPTRQDTTWLLTVNRIFDDMAKLTIRTTGDGYNVWGGYYDSGTFSGWSEISTQVDNVTVIKNSEGKLVAGEGVYLPLTGGEMTGSIVAKKDLIIKGYDEGKMVSIYSADNSTNGAFITLHTKNDSTPGRFELVASTGGLNWRRLSGAGDGTLTWGNNVDIADILTDKCAGNGIDIDSNNKINVDYDDTTITLNSEGKLCANASGDYLPLAGGTMTGTIQSSISDALTASTDDSHITISGATNSNSGASLSLRGKDVARNKGCFELTATDGDYSTTLQGSAGGSLTWGGDNVYTTNEMQGQGYGTCSTASGTTAKTASITDFELVKGGICAIKFQYAVPANATLNINNTGAKLIYYKGSKITADVIKGGDTATFIYDNTNYQLISIDTSINKYLPLAGGTMTGTIKSSITDIVSSTKTDSYVQINGGTNSDTGASLLLRGKGSTSSDGDFSLKASNGTDSTILWGSPGGSLQWGGNPISYYKEEGVSTSRSLSDIVGSLPGLGTFHLFTRLSDSGFGGVCYLDVTKYSGGCYKAVVKSVTDNVVYIVDNDGTTTTYKTLNTEVKSAESTDNTAYPILLNNGTSATTNTVLFDSGLTMNPSTNLLTVPGNISVSTNEIQNTTNSKTQKLVFGSGSTTAEGQFTLQTDGKTGTKSLVGKSDGTLTWDGNNVYTTNEMQGQGYATCATAATTTAKVATLTNYKLVKGGIVTVRFTYAVPASSTLNINSTGGKSIYYNNAAIAANIIAAGDDVTFVYDGTYYRVISITKPKLTITGIAYATCSTASATAAKTVNINSFQLVNGVLLRIKFTNAITGTCTLNVTNTGASSVATGAKSIYYKGANITSGVINSGDTALLMYNGTQYEVLSVDTSANKYLPLAGGTMTGTIKSSSNMALTLSVDDQYIEIDGGTSWSNGSGLSLRGKSATDNPGGFYLSANDGTNYHDLAGKADGTLTWSGKDILTAGNSRVLLASGSWGATSTLTLDEPYTKFSFLVAESTVNSGYIWSNIIANPANHTTGTTCCNLTNNDDWANAYFKSTTSLFIAGCSTNYKLLRIYGFK